MLAALRKASAARSQQSPNTSQHVDKPEDAQPAATATSVATAGQSSDQLARTTSMANGPQPSSGSLLKSLSHDTVSSGQDREAAPTPPAMTDLALPRLLRPLPKRRRIYLFQDGENVQAGSKAASPELEQSGVPALSVAQGGDASSITSSTGTGQATLYDPESYTPVYSTPATVDSRTASSDEDQHAHAGEKTLLDSDYPDEADEDVAALPVETTARIIKMPLEKKYIDPGKRDREKVSPNHPIAHDAPLSGSLAQSSDGTELPRQVSTEDGMLSLSDIERLVKGVAVGQSLFGAAGLVACLSGMGLYTPASTNSVRSNVPAKGSAQAALASLPLVNDPALDELAKLASWASCPLPLDPPIDVQPAKQNSTSNAADMRRLREAQRELLSMASAGSFDGLLRNEPIDDSQGTDEELLDDGDDATFSRDYTDSYQRAPDAFDANDLERWAYQQEKLFSDLSDAQGVRANNARAGSSTSKKRKVPSARGRETSAELTRRSSRVSATSINGGFNNETQPGNKHASSALPLASALDSLAPWLEKDAMTGDTTTLSDFTRGTAVLAQAINAITASIVGLSIVTRMKPGRIPRSSRTFQRYHHFRKLRRRRLILYTSLTGTGAARDEELVVPSRLLPESGAVLALRRSLATPQTAAAAASKTKKKKPKAKSSNQTASPTVPDLLSMAPPKAIGFLDDMSRNPTALGFLPTRPPHTVPIDEYEDSPFTFAAGSDEFARELQLLLAQKRHLLGMLRTRRKEELIRKKVELEEEKERLSRVLAAGVANRQAQVAKGAALTTVGEPAPLDAATVSKTPLKKGKKKRSAYANANNVHHRQNYIPSRLPAAPVVAKGHEGNEMQRGASAGMPLPDGVLPHDNKSAVFNFGVDEWMCMFCEYELWYGSKPQLARCAKKRKKLLKVRQKAVERAKGAIEGKPTKKGSAKPASSAAPAALPGTAQHQEKAENAKPTRAPPSTPVAGDASALEASPPKAAGATTTNSAAHNGSGVTQVALLAYHCLAKGLSQPVYTQALYPNPTPPLYDITIGDAVYIPMPAPDAEDWTPISCEKEDVAAKVLRGLLLQESLMPNESEALASQGIVAVRKGDELPIEFVQHAATSYGTNQDLLHDYCRLTWRTPPTYVVQQEADNFLPSVYLVLGGEMFPANGTNLTSTDFPTLPDSDDPDIPEWERECKEELAISWLEQTVGGIGINEASSEGEGDEHRFDDVD